MTDQYDKLSPSGVSATLRSLPRRYGSAVSEATSTLQRAALVDALGPGGTSLSELMNEAATSISVFGQSLRSAATATKPTVRSDLLDANVLQDLIADDRPAMLVKNAHLLLADEATGLANHFDGLSAEAWTWDISVVGASEQRSVNYLQLAQALARRQIDLLRKVEAQANWIASEAND